MSKPIPGKTRDDVKFRSRGTCEAKMNGCSWVATEIHHRKLRSRRGTNDLSNLLHLCNKCHEKITDMRKGTERFRTHSWQREGIGENGEEWQP